MMTRQQRELVSEQGRVASKWLEEEMDRCRCALIAAASGGNAGKVIELGERLQELHRALEYVVNATWSVANGSSDG